MLLSSNSPRMALEFERLFVVFTFAFRILLLSLCSFQRTRMFECRDTMDGKMRQRTSADFLCSRIVSLTFLFLLCNPYFFPYLPYYNVKYSQKNFESPLSLNEALMVEVVGIEPATS